MVKLWKNLLYERIKTNGKKIKVDNKLASIILKHNNLNSKLSSRKVAEIIKVISNIDISH